MEKELYIAELDSSIVKERILIVRGKKVMLDRDLAELYGVETKTLNQAVKRNIERFPEDFMLKLNTEEVEISSRSQIVTLNRRGSNMKYQPYAFTEQGIAMLSSVLNSTKAIQINIQIIRIFTKMRDMVDSYKDLARRISQIEELLSVLIKQEENPKERIGFDTGG
jgi:phage regulator Rha-like protein